MLAAAEAAAAGSARALTLLTPPREEEKGPTKQDGTQVGAAWMRDHTCCYPSLPLLQNPPLTQPLFKRRIRIAGHSGSRALPPPAASSCPKASTPSPPPVQWPACLVLLGRYTACPRVRWCPGQHWASHASTA